MTSITTYHWIFAGVFAIVFLIALAFAYQDDAKKAPDMFKGSSGFLLAVVLIIMVFIVVKILYRVS